LGNEASSVGIRNISNAIRQEILEGSTFAGTIAKYTNIFDRIYIGLVKAGEDSGEMDKTLGRLAELLNKQASINTRVFGAMLYPVFVVVFVFPKFAEAFSSTGKALPPITQFCIDLGNNIKGFWYLYIIGVVGFVFLCIQLPKWPSSRKILDRWALKIPVINDLVVKSNFSNYLSVLLVAYNAGIPIVDSLYLSTLTLTNVVLKDALEGVSKKVQQGAQMSGAMKSSGVVPKMVTFMVSTGEQSGRLGELLENAVSFIDQELDKAIDVMTKMMEPLLIVVIGVIVLFLALALYLPLFGMADV
jgi:type IV pilus assembly protein PilC